MRNILSIIITAIIVVSCGKADENLDSILGGVTYIPVNVFPAENVKFKWNEENELTTIEVPAEGAAFSVTGADAAHLYLSGIRVSIYGQTVEVSNTTDSIVCHSEWLDIRAKRFEESASISISENTSSMPRGVDITCIGVQENVAKVKIIQAGKANDN